MSRNEAKTGGTPDTDFSALDRELAEMARETPEVPADFHAGWTRAVREEAARRQAAEEVDLPDTITPKTDIRWQRRYILSAAAAFVLIIGGAMLLKDRQDSLLNRVKTDPPAVTQTAEGTPAPEPALTPALTPAPEPAAEPAPEPEAVYAAGNAAEMNEAPYMAMALRADESAAETEEAYAIDAEAIPAEETADMAEAADEEAAEEETDAARSDAGAAANELKNRAKAVFGAALSSAAELPAEAPAEETEEAETENAAELPAEASAETPAEEAGAGETENTAVTSAETAAKQAPASAVVEAAVEEAEDASFLQRLWVGFLRITPWMLAIVGTVLFLVTYIIRVLQRKRKK